MLRWTINARNYVRLAPETKIIIGVVYIFLYLSIHFVIFSTVFRALKGKNLFHMDIVILPAWWVALEYLLHFHVSQFPWTLMGYSQYKNLHLIQLADAVGVFGISFFIILISYLLYKILFLKKSRGLNAVLLILILSFIVSYNLVRLHEFGKSSQSQKIKVVMVQDKIDDNEPWWTPESFRNAFKNMLTLSSEAIRVNPDLIIWPEGAVPFAYNIGGDLNTLLNKIQKELTVPLLFGGDECFQDGRLFNTAYLITHGELSGKYRKQKPAILGEYLPKILFLIRKNTLHISPLSADKVSNVLKINAIPFGTYICCEAAFPDVVRRFVKRGAMFLANISNDTVFGNTSGNIHHFIFSVFRAVENRRWVVRCSSIGKSAFISPAGKIFSPTKIFEKTSRIGEIDLIGKKSLYSKNGDAFSFFCIALSFASLILLIRWKLRANKPPRH